MAVAADVKQLGRTSPNALGFSQGPLQIVALRFRNLFLEIDILCREFSQWASPPNHQGLSRNNRQ